MKLKPEMMPLLMKLVVSALALAAWYFMGKPVDETQVSDLVQLLSGLLIGKEFLKPTGAGK